MIQENVIVQDYIHMKKECKIQDIDYIEIYTGNARQAVFYYCKLLGFKISAYRGLETGSRDVVSYLLTQGDMRFVISSSYLEHHDITNFVKRHGDGVKDIAFRVDNVEDVYERAIASGGVSLQKPTILEDEYGTIKKAVVGACGETVHTLIERINYMGTFMPGYEPFHHDHNDIPDTGLKRVDHFAICVEDMEHWTNFYQKIFDFSLQQTFNKDDVSSTTSSLMTKILQNGTERIKFTIVEPAKGKRKSQIREFLEYNGGAGVQHIAFLTEDIIYSVDKLISMGKSFLHTPKTYYEVLTDRVGPIDEPIHKLEELNILVDRDEEGYLLQIFGHPLTDRPTMFFEIIQRKGSLGFGKGNIRALFEAVEREQQRRGNL